MRSKMSKSSYPIKVTLHFKNENEKQVFMDQLSDGIGENFVSLDWSDKKDFDDCYSFNVSVWDEFLSEYNYKTTDNDEEENDYASSEFYEDDQEFDAPYDYDDEENE